ncbi:hypothetical protein [Lacipirellula parvula]|uniref:Uncharacterized protein n=1 Tax=Lacipirellula parvula TaxID=2650471 RepID=A0A5K7XH05_9BACT|nr:hypothetical protein [Lacipirellula parvula]BBO34221.1 hypothetical protein PLANPX_3833 [Lacipirellula parvula]
MTIDEQFARMGPAQKNLTLALSQYFKALSAERDAILIERLKKRFTTDPAVIKKLLELLRGE